LRLVEQRVSIGKICGVTELFYFLAWRDILVRYKQTVIGIAGANSTVLTMIVFTVVFGRLAKLPSDGAPYPILVFAAMPCFSNALRMQ
jgi:lipopolysaccharide transport system permease protein